MLARQGVILPGTNCFHDWLHPEDDTQELLEIVESCAVHQHAMLLGEVTSIYSGDSPLHPDAKTSLKNHPEIVNQASGMCPKCTDVHATASFRAQAVNSKKR